MHFGRRMVRAYSRNDFKIVLYYNKLTLQARFLVLPKQISSPVRLNYQKFLLKIIFIFVF